ncbi:formate dehydrogenase-N subunit alpha [Pelomonas saccharophila]|uniref:Formate dehydrogenase (Quinone-dependent) catalytic subunit n=3 Tax=Roseateles saccharophilus TaxID=304 RepID=A0A4R3UDK3_ROSSA|nr:formate dehydrogenase-N subunit alpha [Roseateles saccharophilus]TCU85479.1 formate dehydrogenase (quinone-dependent) catalytic subunit [Roseateles saccharophilus]
MTNHWVDIKNADVVLIMGGNAAEAHPCGFKWVIEAKHHNKARLVVVDPRFTRSAAMSDYYAPIRAGSDIAFLGGVINYLLSNDKIQHEYVKNYTNASFIVGEDYKFEDGIFSGYDEAKRRYDPKSWGYELDEKGFAKVDPTLAHPRCVLNVMKAHYARYTPEQVSKVTGTPKDKFLKVCEMIAETARPDKVMTIMYALGWTQHSQGSQMIRTGAIMQLLLGNIGLPGGGMNALRGHSNIQGLTDLGLLSTSLTGYMSLARDSEQDLETYYKPRATKPLRPGQMSFWQNYPKFFVSQQKAWWGKAATKENDWAFHYLPKWDKGYDVLQAFELMGQGKLNGYICQGFNPVGSFPNKKKIIAGLSKLKYLVIIDPLNTETAEFWKNYGEHNDVKSEEIQTTVFRFPSTCFAEEEGSLTNSGRWLQWHWKGAEPPGEAKGDAEIIAELFTRMKAAYVKEGGAFPDPIVNLTWPYLQPTSPSAEELAREYNGKALADVLDPKDPTKVLAKAGEQLGAFSLLRDDGSTSSGCWIYAGAWTQAGNQMARRDNADPWGIGQTLNWAWAWPANRRVLYNTASCDTTGRPWNAKRKLVAWNGEKWGGSDVPDIRPDANPADADAVRPFIMTGEGVARLFAPSGMADGPLPEHYEPFETPLAANPMHPGNAKAKSNPAARVFKGDMEAFGTPKDFPYVATSYRLTEHFHYWTKHALTNAIVQPQQFVEIGEELAKEKGIANGDWVKVSSNRGFIKAVVVVSKRIASLDVDGKRVHTVGLPNHWGFVGLAKPGYLVNTLTPFVGDANTQTPEFKSFTVNIEKA